MRPGKIKYLRKEKKEKKGILTVFMYVSRTTERSNSLRSLISLLPSTIVCITYRRTAEHACKLTIPIKS